MNEVAGLLTDITPGNWGIILTLLGFGVTYLLREWRETRKLSSEERLARREGFAAQVDLLMSQLSTARGENRLLLGDMHSLRLEYDNHRKICFAETQQLRDMVVDQQEQIEGLKRKVTTQAYEIAKLKGFDDGD